MSVNGHFKSTIIGCALRASFAFAIIWDINMFKSHSKRHQEPPLITKFCQNKTCVQLDMRKVLRFYPNLFVPVDRNMCQFERKINSDCTSKSIFTARDSYNSDHDTCCPTALLFDNLPVRTNIRGEERVIVQCSLFQQLIPTGSCLKGTCTTCTLVYRTMSILVVKFGNYTYLPLEFDQFQIPMYCTCYRQIRLNVS